MEQTPHRYSRPQNKQQMPTDWRRNIAKYERGNKITAKLRVNAQQKQSAYSKQ